MFCGRPNRRDEAGNWRAPACTGSDGRCSKYCVYLDRRPYFPRQYARKRHTKTRDTQSNTCKLQAWQFTISPRLHSHLSAAARGNVHPPTLCATLQDAHAVTRCARGCHSVCAGLDFTCFPRGAQTYTWKRQATIFTIFPLRVSSFPRAATTKTGNLGNSWNLQELL